MILQNKAIRQVAKPGHLGYFKFPDLDNKDKFLTRGKDG